MNVAWSRPAHHPPLLVDELHIWRAHVDAGPEALAYCATLLSCDETVRADRFVFAQDRNRYVATRGLLRHLLARYLDVLPVALRFAYAPQGKPYLDGPAHASTLQFNVAHSGDLALVGVSRVRCVGVDVERMRPEVDFRTLARTVFSPAELATLERPPDDAARIAFFTAWARKEAFVKARGDGISFSLARVTVTLLPGEPPQLLLPADADAAVAARAWTLHALEVGPGYTAAAVSEGPAQLRCFAAALPAHA